MTTYCNTPHMKRIEKIREKRSAEETISKLQEQRASQVPSENLSEGIVAPSLSGAFPILARPDMTELVIPIPCSDSENCQNAFGGASSGSAVSHPSRPDLAPIGDLSSPESPSFEVPSHPLLPPGYKETLTYSSLQYLSGFYSTQIGRYVRVEYQTTSNSLEYIQGFLVGVGANYLLLQDTVTGNVTAIDSYSVKLFHVYYNYSIEGLLD